MFGAVRGDLLWGDKSDQVSLHLLHAHHLMTIELIPFLVHSCFRAFLTGQLLKFIDFLKFILDVKQMVDVEGCLEATSTLGTVNDECPGLVDHGQPFDKGIVDSEHESRQAVEVGCRGPDRLGM